jgi:hypothetical protein
VLRSALGGRWLALAANLQRTKWRHASIAIDVRRAGFPDPFEAMSLVVWREASPARIDDLLSSRTQSPRPEKDGYGYSSRWF